MILLTGGRFGRRIATVTVVVAALITVGCPTPIDMSIAEQLSDGSLPFVSVTSPEDGEVYSQTVTVSGTAQDADGEIRFLTYVVSGTLGVLLEDSPDVTTILSEDTFEFTFSTVGFTGPIELRVTVTDWNDNTASDSVSLQYSGSQLSSFTAEPGNKSVTLDWEALPEAESYTIYYTDNGTLPSESYGSSVDVTEVGHELTGLANGALHTFVLSANADGEPIFWSNYIRSIPLSPFTLAPRVRGEYRKIELEWQEIAGAGEYEVYRATSPDGPYTNYTGTISGTSFTDTGISEGVWYYYKVKPALEGAELSTYNAARSVAIPVATERLSSAATPDPAQKVAVSGNYAYVAAGSGGLLVLDVTVPGEPKLIGSLGTTNAQDVDADGTTVYVADGSAGVLAVDASVPSTPIVVGTYIGDIVDAKRIVVDGENDNVFVIDGSGETALLALDATDPASLTLRETVTATDNTYEALTVFAREAGGVHYSTLFVVGDGDAGGTIFRYSLDDADGSFSLDESRFFSSQFPDAEAQPEEVTTDGTSIYALFSPPAIVSGSRPYYLWTFSTLHDGSIGQISLEGFAADIAYANDRVVAVDEYNLQVFDVTDVENPVHLFEFDTPAKPTGVDLTDGSYAFIAAGTPYFQTVDLYEPTAPSVIGSYATSSVSDLRIRGDYAYTVAGSPYRLQILNVSDSTSPVETGSLELDFPNGIALSGPYAFVAKGSHGLEVVDISDPSAPVSVGSTLPIAGSLVALEVRGDYVFAAGSAGLEIFDVADPTNPGWAGLVDSGTGGMKGVAIRGTRAFVIEGSYMEPNAFKIVDVETPTGARLTVEVDLQNDPASIESSPPTFVTVSQLALDDDYAYLTDDYCAGGFATVNTDTESPDYLATRGFFYEEDPDDPDDNDYHYLFDPVDGEPTTDPHAAYGIAVNGEYAFVGTAEAGLVVMDVTDPTAPTRIVDTGNVGFTPRRLRLSGPYIYAAAGGDGFRIIQLQ